MSWKIAGRPKTQCADPRHARPTARVTLPRRVAVAIDIALPGMRTRPIILGIK